MILTYGKDDTDAPECIARLLEEKGRHVNYINSILMVDNYLPFFDMNEQRTMNKNIEQQIQQALQDIQNKKEEFEKCEIADLYLRINCLAVWKALDKKLLVKSYAKNLH